MFASDRHFAIPLAGIASALVVATAGLVIARAPAPPGRHHARHEHAPHGRHGRRGHEGQGHGRHGHEGQGHGRRGHEGRGRGTEPFAVAGYPGSRTTGVPASARLLAVPRQVSRGRGWYYDARGWVDVTRQGTVLAGLYIPHDVEVTAAHVTIRDDLIVVGGGNSVGISLRHAFRVTIEHCTIRGRNARAGRMMAGIKDFDGRSAGLVIRRNDISLFETGVQVESGLIEGNFIHHPGYRRGDHTNGILSSGGTRLLRITRNTILINRGQTDAIGLFEDFGAQANRTITGNYLAGGAYAIYAGQRPGGPATRRIVIRDNRISSLYYPRGGHFGCVADFNLKGRGNVWTDNSWNTRVVAAIGRCA